MSFFSLETELLEEVSKLTESSRRRRCRSRRSVITKSHFIISYEIHSVDDFIYKQSRRSSDERGSTTSLDAFMRNDQCRWEAHVLNFKRSRFDEQMCIRIYEKGGRLLSEKEWRKGCRHRNISRRGADVIRVVRIGPNPSNALLPGVRPFGLAVRVWLFEVVIDCLRDPIGEWCDEWSGDPSGSLMLTADDREEGACRLGNLICLDLGRFAWWCDSLDILAILADFSMVLSKMF